MPIFCFCSYTWGNIISRYSIAKATGCVKTPLFFLHKLEKYSLRYKFQINSNGQLTTHPLFSRCILTSSVMFTDVLVSLPPSLVLRKRWPNASLPLPLPPLLSILLKYCRLLLLLIRHFRLRILSKSCQTQWNHPVQARVEKHSSQEQEFLRTPHSYK